MRNRSAFYFSIRQLFRPPEAGTPAPLSAPGGGYERPWVRRAAAYPVRIAMRGCAPSPTPGNRSEIMHDLYKENNTNFTKIQ